RLAGPGPLLKDGHFRAVGPLADRVLRTGSRRLGTPGVHHHGLFLWPFFLDHQWKIPFPSLRDR
ncbi:unnamed protein product, partial [Musa textilis]